MLEKFEKFKIENPQVIYGGDKKLTIDAGSGGPE